MDTYPHGEPQLGAGRHPCSASGPLEALCPLHGGSLGVP